MKRTLISNFYNEEYLLPWFLKHHREVFHHGIMINYGSTDSSCEIIQELCPTWEIVDSRNRFWDPFNIDREGIDIESNISGWKMFLNTTEFLIGNYSILNEEQSPQLLVPNICFVDKQRDYNLTYDMPLYKQRVDGYAFWDKGSFYGGDCFNIRCARSIHKIDVNYISEVGPGRHYTRYSTNDLVLFYYGFCPFNETIMQRKLNIGDKMSPDAKFGLHHKYPREVVEQIYAEQHLPLARDLTADIQPYIDNHMKHRICNEYD